MSFEDDMIEYGFSDGNDYMDYLMDEADRMYEKQEEHNRRAEGYEAWLNSLSVTERLYLQEEENIQRRGREKRQKDAKQKRLDEELVLKLWAKDNPQKAKMWYAYYTRSSEVNNVHFEQFLEKLGTSAVYSCSLNSLWNGYMKWKHWLERYEAYQEFKLKDHDIWKQIKVNKYREYIKDAALKLLNYTEGTPSSKENRLFYFSCCKKGATFKAWKILNKWINSHSELWEEIPFKYKSVLKTENDYLFQAWLETFQWADAFTVWKIKNPTQWKQFQSKCNKGLVVDENKLQSAWMEKHKEEWDNWKRSQSKIWIQSYENHRTFLWYAYVEVQWIKFLEKKKVKDEEEREKEKKGTEYLHDRCKNEDYDPELGVMEDLFCTDTEQEEYDTDEQYLYDEVSLVDEKIEEEPKYRHLEKGDPRFVYQCKDNIEEDKIHDIFITQYEKELSENTDKALFIQQHCSEYGFNVFLNRTKYIYYNSWDKISIKIEESPDEFANRKILDLWIAQHKIQWQKWKYRYCWTKEYDGCGYSKEEYYEVWKQLKADRWEKWQTENFESWKSKAQSMDLWFAWLSDKNEWTFHEWASLHLKEWEHFMDEAMNLDYHLAYQSFFGGVYTDFDKWKKENLVEWEYWKEAIREQILIYEFTHNSIDLTYQPEYELNIQIQEKLYWQKIGRDVFHNHLAVIQDNNKYGFINEDGFIVIKPQFDDALPFKDGIVAVKIGESTYDEYIQEFGDYVEIKIGGKWGFINIKGEFVFEPQFDNIAFIKDDMIIFSKGGDLEISNGTYKLKKSKWGMMNKNMQEIIPAKYDFLRLLDNGLFTARKKVGTDYKWALLSNKGIEITPFEYSYIYNSEEKCLIANKGSRYETDANGCSDYYDGEWGYIDLEGKEIEPFIFADSREVFIAMWECMHS